MSKLYRGLERFQPGKSLTQSLNIDGFYNSVGASSSKGYREYKSSGDKYQNNVICYTFTELGKVINKSLRLQVESTLNSDPKYTVSNGPSSSNKLFATFYIGDVLMGCELKDVVECISAENIKSFTNMPRSTKGVLLYKDQLVVVVNPTAHFAIVTPTLDLDQIVIIRTDQGFMGLLVNHLGDVPEVSNEYIIKVNEMSHNFNSSIELIVKSTSTENAGAMFFVINPDKFLKSVLSGFCLEELTFMKNQLKAA